MKSEHRHNEPMRSQHVNAAAISVVMANYNNGRYIDEAIRSVQNQTFQNWELIIVDDASTDDSLKRITSYLRDPRIRLFMNNQNEGYTRSLLRGFEQTASPVIGILDSDDALMPEALSRVHSLHAAQPEVGLVLTQVFKCDSDLNPLLTTLNTTRHLADPLIWMRGPTAFRVF